MSVSPLERFEVSTGLLAPAPTPGGPEVVTRTIGVQPQQGGSPAPLNVQVINTGDGMTVDTGGGSGEVVGDGTGGDVVAEVAAAVDVSTGSAAAVVVDEVDASMVVDDEGRATSSA